MNRKLKYYEQISADIIEKIQNGIYKYGDRFLTEQEVENTYNVSRSTVRRTLTNLVSKGYLLHVPNVGHFVNIPEPNPTSPAEEKSLQVYLNELGIDTYCKVLSLDYTLATESEASELQCEINEPLLKLHKVRYVNDQVINDQYYCLIEKFFPKFNPWETIKRSLDDIIKEDYSLEVTEILNFISPELPTKEQVSISGISKDQPILKVKRISKIATGITIGSDIIYTFIPIKPYSYVWRKRYNR